ncbi:SOS response-associated peptidase family protein [Paenibacillus sp. 1-18]|uniref:SOS response-associated peptidase family protein n=1 Tax=Paenibacillus sp. 1-18 TaxID=1333846 RepID=UPI00067655CC|nr:SOS response-associated peptidase family protein [Paenibacillus sp. 1-18]
MCGRFTLTADESEIIDTFSVDHVHYEYKPRYNVASSQTIAAVSYRNGGRVLEGYKWGLIPFWAKDMKIGYSMINARVETLQSKPVFGIFFREIALSFLQMDFFIKCQQNIFKNISDLPTYKMYNILYKKIGTK